MKWIINIILLCSMTIYAFSDTWAVVVDTSQFWHNYRHISNALMVYNSLKSMGVPDDNIILMVGDDAICNPRNPFFCELYTVDGELYGNGATIDYRNEDVSVAKFLSLFHGKYKEHTPTSKRLLSGKNANLLIYMTGHGGENFFKFRDREIVTNEELGSALAAAERNHLFKSAILIVDTCKSASMGSHINSDKILFVSSSGEDENSYGYLHDKDIQAVTTDRFSFAMWVYMSELIRIFGLVPFVGTNSQLNRQSKSHQNFSLTSVKRDALQLIREQRVMRGLPKGMPKQRNPLKDISVVSFFKNINSKFLLSNVQIGNSGNIDKWDSTPLSNYFSFEATVHVQPQPAVYLREDGSKADEQDTIHLGYSHFAPKNVQKINEKYKRCNLYDEMRGYYPPLGQRVMKKGQVHALSTDCVTHYQTRKVSPLDQNYGLEFNADLNRNEVKLNAYVTYKPSDEDENNLDFDLYANIDNHFADIDICLDAEIYNRLQYVIRWSLRRIYMATSFLNSFFERQEKGKDECYLVMIGAGIIGMYMMIISIIFSLRHKHHSK